ncbi:hypothetical protein ACERK3_10215 [Phycisphaerales bacterium AB-hyl4]|uniref:Uncharacterized protein n=1 Tax=Natronomicrosphaera hydrolytica TaxID=3242702 RepID=A0ABV4U4Z4_9BACT
MFPPLFQRVFIPIAAIVAGMAWLWAAPLIEAADGRGGLSLFDAQVGVVFAVLLMLLTGLVAIVLAVLVGAMGNPLSGLFVLGVALLFPAIMGGRIDGWLWRHGEPTAYVLLIVEMIVWTGALLGVIVLMDAARQPIRDALPRLTTTDHFGKADPGVRLPDGRALIAGLVCAGVGGALATLLIAVSDTGQVIGSLVLAFGIAAVVTQSIVPQSNPLPLLISPALLAIVAYAHVPVQYGDAVELYAAWYVSGVWGPALALPIHYLGAGLVGVTAGLGMHQSIEHSRAALATPA